MNKNADGFFKSLEQLFLKANFTRLNSDFDNIDEIYNNNINIWYYFQSDCVTKKDGNKEVNSKLDTINNNILLNPDNFIFCKTQKGFPLTEVNFIDTEIKNLLLIDRDKLSFSEQNQIKFYSEYLSKKRNLIEWTNNDYYNHYIETNRFAFQIFWAFKSNEYDNVINDLKEYKIRYDYIFNKLSIERKIEFKNDFCDRLEKLKSKQTESKFKEVITNLIDKINLEYYKIASNDIYNINEYKQSYKSNHFNDIINKQNEDKTTNVLFYRPIITNLLKQRDDSLLSKTNLKERHELLTHLNKDLFYLTDNTIQLFKAVNNYANTNNSGYLTRIKTKEDEVLNSLNNIKEFAEIIKHNLIEDKIYIASKIRDYSLLMFDDWINVLKTQIGIDIYSSPLKAYFENVKKELEKSINLDELKLINKLNGTAQLPQRIENIKTDEIKPKKIAEKWYALLYWIDVNANGKQPPKDIEGNFIKSEIETIGSEKTKTTGQSFYRNFIKIDVNNSKELDRMFGKDWKKTIIELSNNDNIIIDYIKNKFTT